MYPKLFEIGPFSVYSYGLMLGIAFIIGSWLFGKELKRVKLDENIGVIITFLALIGGIVGAKLFFIIEEWNFGKGSSFSALFKPDVLFSASGLTFYGGLILSIVFIFIYCRVKKLSMLRIFDLMAPAAMLGYGIARIGCHLSGDGDYGCAVNGTFWEFLGYSYEKGTVPTAHGVLVHPAPLYELVAAVIIFIFLWRIRKKVKFTGQLFAYYLILSGFERLLIEIIRVNPRIIFGLSQAQIIAVITISAGLIILAFKKKLPLLTGMKDRK
jgi:phosphatidylglycerol:prolipoprotein diacylglycerol transferase